MVSFVTGLRCRECQRAFPAEALHVCDYCFGPLEVAYDYERIAAAITRERIAAGPRSIWRYRDLLPVDDATPVSLGAGFTPLVRADRLAAELGLGELWIKNDTLNPTGSFKDRVVSVALTKVAKGFKELYTVGLLDDEPHVRISGAQATGCSPVAQAFAAGRDVVKPV